MAEDEEKRIDSEQHFILRLPLSPAAALKSALRSGSRRLRHKFQIKLETDMRHADVRFEDWHMKAKIYELPSVVESYKSVDRKVLHKIADITQIMVCVEDKMSECERPEIDKECKDKRFLYPHGLTPCLKNVRKHRFRKPLRNKNSELSIVEKEVKMLLKTDEEAINYNFKLVTAEEDKVIFVKNADETYTHSDIGEHEIFGAFLSNSEESGTDEVNVTMLNNAKVNDKSEINISFCSRIMNNELEVDQNQDSKGSEALNYKLESEAAERNLKQILHGAEAKDKNRLFEKLNMLEEEINIMLYQKDVQEHGILSLDNEALKQRFQQNIMTLKIDIEQKQKEYKDVEQMLFYI